MSGQMTPLLKVDNITKSFGGFVALESVGMTIQQGEIHAVIGPNGAGKTTLFNLMTGMIKQDSGSFLFAGEPIDTLRPFERTVKGIARTFQNIRLFKQMSVLENILVAQHCKQFSSIWQAFRLALFHPPWGLGQKEKEMREFAYELLEFVGLSHQRKADATDLPYGELRLLEIARALALKPKLLLLDEPAAGMNANETEKLDDLINRICQSGTTVMLVEHDMNLVMEISHRITVLNFGNKIAEGIPFEIQQNPEVIVAYLGSDD